MLMHRVSAIALAVLLLIAPLIINVREAGADGPRRINHIVIIVMENAEFGQVIGPAPYQTSLANQYALAYWSYGVTHPSLPNYVALTSGSNLGVTTNVIDLVLNATNIVDLLEAKGFTWKGYMESIPSTGYTGQPSNSPYAKRHNPFVYYRDILNNTARLQRIVPLPQLDTDLVNNQLPSFSFIVPNNNNNGHDTGVLYGDNFLSNFIPKLTNSPSFADMAIFITYDEGSTSLGFNGLNGGRIATILVSPFAVRGYVSQGNYTHYSLLSTVEANFNLGTLGRNDTVYQPMSDMFTVSLGLPTQPPGAGCCDSRRSLKINMTGDSFVKKGQYFNITTTLSDSASGSILIYAGDSYIGRELLASKLLTNDTRLLISILANWEGKKSVFAYYGGDTTHKGNVSNYLTLTSVIPLKGIGTVRLQPQFVGKELVAVLHNSDQFYVQNMTIILQVKNQSGVIEYLASVSIMISANGTSNLTFVGEIPRGIAELFVWRSLQSAEPLSEKSIIDL